MMARELWDWKFKVLNDSDYELRLSFVVKDSFFMKVFSKGVSHFAPGYSDARSVSEFFLESSYLPKVKGYVKKCFRITRDDVFIKTGRFMMDYDVYSVFYKRRGKFWDMFVVLRGVFVLK